MDPVQINKSDIVNWENPQIRQILADQLDLNLHVSETISRIEKLTGARPSVNIVTQRVRRYREKRDKAMNPGISSHLKHIPDANLNLQNQPICLSLPYAVSTSSVNENANSAGSSDMFRDHLAQQHAKPNHGIQRTADRVPRSSDIETLLFSVAVNHTNGIFSTLLTTKNQSQHISMSSKPTSTKTEHPNKLEDAISGISSLFNVFEPTRSAVSPAISKVQTHAATSIDVLFNNGKLVRAHYLFQIRKTIMYCLDQVNYLHTIGENFVGFNNHICFNYADKAALDDPHRALCSLVRFHEPHFTLETANSIRNCLNSMKEDMDFSDSPLADLTGYRLDQFKSILGIIEKKLKTIIEIHYDNTGSINTVAAYVAGCIHPVWILVNELRRAK
uniref:Clr5 domain-containing protein n=1 Tax=Panagrellus redivivus TaxID=6233 RepID=A0A7E4VEW8_PANRE